MKPKIWAILLFLGATLFARGGAVISESNGIATISFTNLFHKGVGTLEQKVGKRWEVLQNFFTTSSIAQVSVPVPTNHGALRFKALDVSATPLGFAHLLQAYGNIHTIAGKGEVPPGTNSWRPEYEGAFATNVNLSNPQFAMADKAESIYVVEQDGHAVVKITPDGRIHTVMGTHQPGTNSVRDGDFGTNAQLRFPTGMWLLDDDTMFVLDAGNDRVIRMDSNGIIFFSPAIPFDVVHGARGLWVAPELEGEFYFAAGTELRKYEAAATTPVKLYTGFLNLANVILNPSDQIIVTDQWDNRVYRVRTSNGQHILRAGNGFTRGLSRGGDAEDVSLPGARGIWYLPTGGYFVGLDEGARIWYVDDDDVARPFVKGSPGAHSGDGKWFRAAAVKVGNVRSVTMTPAGHIIIVEARGFVRKIDFLRHVP
jgi:hypothetical protein